MKSPVLLALLALGINWSTVLADKTVIIDGGDPQIKYITGNNPNTTDPTWTEVGRSPDVCDTPQRVTERIGDYVTFTFTGTSIFVVGTRGKKRGIINFSFDGQNSTYDRTTPDLQCNEVLFQKLNLPFQQHTLIATLDQKQTSFVNGMQVGVLSIQRIRYTVPGKDDSAGGGSKVPVIVGAAIGVGALIAFAFGLFFFLRRRRRIKHKHRTTGFFDTDDIPPHREAHPGLSTVVTTPFQWDGPQYAQSEAGTQELGSRQGGFNSSSDTGFVYPNNSYPNSPRAEDPLLNRRGSSNPSSHSRSDERRESKTNYRDSKATYVTNNPDTRPGSNYGGPSSPPTEDQLVDRIALRLADIMHSRGAAGPMLDMPPPLYEPGGSSSGQQGANLQRQPTHSTGVASISMSPSTRDRRESFSRSQPPTPSVAPTSFAQAYQQTHSQSFPVQHYPPSPPQPAATIHPQYSSSEGYQTHQPWTQTSDYPGFRSSASPAFLPPSPPANSYDPLLPELGATELPYRQRQTSPPRRPTGPRQR